MGLAGSLSADALDEEPSQLLGAAASAAATAAVAATVPMKPLPRLKRKKRKRKKADLKALDPYSVEMKKLR